MIINSYDIMVTNTENINFKEPVELISEWKHTKYITLSSLLFLIPAYYAYAHNMYDHTILLILTSLISANYWRKATYSWRRNLDLIISKVSFAIYIYNGVKYSGSRSELIEGILRLIFMVYCFCRSGYLFQKKQDSWVGYHILFHIFIALEQLRILNNIIKGCEI
jgi:uncharacterized membrane protein